MSGTSFDPRWLNTVDQLYHYGWSTQKLLRIRMLAESIRHFWPKGHPTRLVHVAGSNGKGSTCRMLEAALGTLGPAGSWVNPHLFDYVERFRVHGAPADRGLLADLWETRVLPHSLDREQRAAGQGLSFAEAGILLALQLFEHEGIRWAALETGVGGRYAPTMALQPDLCLLTNVGSDHPRTLGSQGWQVALEKAGIARPGIPLYSTVEGDNRHFVRLTAESRGAPCVLLGEEERQTLGELLPPDRRAQRGRHWLGNAALALAAARHLEPGLDPATAVAAMDRAQPLEGRFWRIGQDVLADVAHNRDKITALAADLVREFPGRPIHLLAGLSRQRGALEVLQPPAAPGSPYHLYRGLLRGAPPRGTAGGTAGGRGGPAHGGGRPPGPGLRPAAGGSAPGLAAAGHGQCVHHRPGPEPGPLPPAAQPGIRPPGQPAHRAMRQSRRPGQPAHRAMRQSRRPGQPDTRHRSNTDGTGHLYWGPPRTAGAETPSHPDTACPPFRVSRPGANA
jgi:dihydrofolate synthase/folylpolyglutamate synthase